MNYLVAPFTSKQTIGSGHLPPLRNDADDFHFIACLRSTWTMIFLLTCSLWELNSKKKIVADSLKQLKERVDNHLPDAPLYSLSYLDHDIGEYVDLDEDFFTQQPVLQTDDASTKKLWQEARVNIISTKSSKCLNLCFFYLSFIPTAVAWIPTLLYFMTKIYRTQH